MIMNIMFTMIFKFANSSIAHTENMKFVLNSKKKKMRAS